MSRNTVNTYEAETYAVARATAKDLAQAGLPKAHIKIDTVSYEGGLALHATLISPGPHSMEDIEDWMGCVAQDVGVQWALPIVEIA